MTPMLWRPAVGQGRRLDLAPQHVVGGCSTSMVPYSRGAVHLLRAEVGDADGVDAALGAEAFQRLHGGPDRDIRVRPVDEVDLHVIGIEAT